MRSWRLFTVILLLTMPLPAAAEVLTIREMLALVGKNNPTLQAEALSPLIAAEAIAQAKSGYLPRIDAKGAYTVQPEAQAVVIGGRTEPTQEATYPSANLTIEQTLYDFGRTAARVAQARALATAATYDFRGVKQDIYLRAIATYFGILEAEKLVAAAQQEVEQFADHLRVAESLYRQGVVTRNDELQAQVQLAASRQQLLARENELQNRWLALNYLTGRLPEARDELEEVYPFPLEETPPAVAAVADRPELQAQQQAVIAARANAQEVRKEYWPTFYAKGAADYVENEYVAEQTIYSAAVGVRANLFDGLAKPARYRQATARLAQERQRLQDLEANAKLDYRTAANDAAVAAARVRVAATAIEQAEENLRINRNRYREQVGTATEVIDAQTLLTRTRSEYYQALFDYELAVARVKRASGELLALFAGG